ncbi:MAG: hypothetical protein NTZ48_03555 [Candidatus Omnitrophica bacterium]|nr:hypothetical protein [Candidatus Omnitrophota bacterium]
MDKAIDFLTNNWLAGFAAVGGWLIGFITDLGKDKWRHKRELKEEHAKIIQKEILTPIYEYLKAFYLPICEKIDTPIKVKPETITKYPEHITETAYAGTKFVIWVRKPERPAKDFMQTEHGYETENYRRYYQDALENHYPELLRRWEEFLDKYREMQNESLDYSQEIAKLLKTALNMQQFSPMDVMRPPWASYEKIAFILYNRQLGIGDEGIKLYDNLQKCGKSTGPQENVFECLTPQDAQKTLKIINGIPKNRKTLDKIEIMCKNLHLQADSLIEALRFEISKAPKPRSCPFV